MYVIWKQHKIPDQNLLTRKQQKEIVKCKCTAAFYFQISWQASYRPKPMPLRPKAMQIDGFLISRLSSWQSSTFTLYY